MIDSLKGFFLGLERYPAFAAALAVFILLGGTHYYQFYLILPIYLYLLSPLLRKVSIVSCVVIALSYFLHNIISPEPMDRVTPSSEGNAVVLQTLGRAEGYAVVLRTEVGKVRLTCAESPPLPGDSISYTAVWYSNSPQTVPGAFDLAKWMKSQRLVAMGRMESVRVIESRFSFQRISFKVRRALEQRLSTLYDKPEASLLMGLLAGDRSGISETLQYDFRKTGLVHVLSISGFHVVMLAGMLTLFLKMFRLPLTAVRVIAIVLLCIYAPITGGSAAVWRAVLMFAVMECGTMFQKNASSINSLGAALILILLCDPDECFDIGFQLSASATLGILLGQTVRLPKMRGNIAKELFNFVVESSLVTLCATLSTIPFLVFYFQTFSVISWIGNLIVVPLIGLGMQAGVLSLIFIHPSVCGLFADAASLLLRAGSQATTFLAGNPYVSATVGPWHISVVILSGVLVGMLFCMKKNRWGKRIAMGSLFVCVLVFAVNEVYKYVEPSWSVVFLDVGQGDLSIIKTPAGKYYMVDAGPPLKNRSMVRDRIVPYLRGQGISVLEALVITHPDLDHYGNAQELMQEFPVRELWTTRCARGFGKESWQRALQAAERQGITVRDLYKGLQVREKLFAAKDEWSLTVLFPDSAFCSNHSNANSIVLRAKGIGGALLLTGDLEREGELELLPLDIKSDILKLGHHGSKTSSTRPFLERVKPEYGIILAAKRNQYRHPSKIVLERLDSLGIQKAGTYDRGTIKVLFSGSGFELK